MENASGYPFRIPCSGGLPTNDYHLCFLDVQDLGSLFNIYLIT